jgi:hypothetical protein
MFDCRFYAPVRERFSMLYEPFGGLAQTWSSTAASIASCHPAGPPMVIFMRSRLLWLLLLCIVAICCGVILIAILSPCFLVTQSPR